MARFLGQLYIAVLSGQRVAHSYGRFRRRRSQVSCYRKVVCGLDVVKCGGADPCGGKAEAYVNVMVYDAGGRSYKIGRTRTATPSDNPTWGDQLVTVIDTDDPPVTAIVDQTRPYVKFQVYDDDGGGNTTFYTDDLLGEAIVYLDQIVDLDATVSGSTRGRRKEMTVPIQHPRDPNAATESWLTVSFSWYDMVKADSLGVPSAYFKRARGNLVTLYHDAHCEDGDFEHIPLGGPLQGLMYKAANCWEDIYASIDGAKHVICICGWSVNTAISLRRSKDPDDTCETIGEMLLRKAEDGCTVCVMVWDDVTSIAGLNMAKDGLMGTYDEYTRQYFEGTPVHCVLATRKAGDDQGFMAGPLGGSLKMSSFTHHQKIVVVDSEFPGGPTQEANPPPSGSRCLTAYVGGLDLTSGRYDTCRHHLFDTLCAEHKDDFYNGCDATVNASCGPREPWHDIHSRVVGPAAWDVYENYVERLQSQGQTAWQAVKTRVNRALNDGTLAPVDFVVCDPRKDPRSWSAQVLRSIDTENAVMNPKYGARYHNPSGLLTDKSIQAAYLYHIDRAKRFIFIENQYFLGSAQFWFQFRDTPAPHLVPYALMKRCVRAIQRDEDFCVYVMTPLFPEGLPNSASVQEILMWQYQTMEMMYVYIAEALKLKGRTDRTPEDYLQFMFPAIREPCSHSDVPHKFQIYVHSKMMIVDDSWVIIGSANINERSMAGGRDSEIAVGLAQELAQVSVDGNSGKPVLPKGDIHAFRLQLWQEHFGAIRPEFEDPATPECARLIYQWTCANLDSLYAEECSDTPLPYGHACMYPVHRNENGSLCPHDRHNKIINTDAPVNGTRSALLPGPLTT